MFIIIRYEFICVLFLKNIKIIPPKIKNINNDKIAYLYEFENSKVNPKTKEPNHEVPLSEISYIEKYSASSPLGISLE